MYLAVKQQLNNLSKEEYLVLRELCHVSKNLYNQALSENAVKPLPLGRGSVNSYSGEYSNVRDNLEQNPQELIVARRLLL